MAAEWLVRDDSTVAIRGDLDFASVAELWQTSESVFRTQQTLVRIDLAELGRTDSSGVALLVGCLRHAQAQQRELLLLNMPAQMRAIVEVAALEQVLPIVDN